jgi:7-alpha-hydroxysteroid dehydrogenase
VSGTGFRLDGRHALITGASRGIGAAIALAFAAAGAAKLTLIARDRQALDRVAAAARGHGAAVDAATCDV